jgi:hypothetical protein
MTVQEFSLSFFRPAPGLWTRVVERRVHTRHSVSLLLGTQSRMPPCVGLQRQVRRLVDSSLFGRRANAHSAKTTEHDARIPLNSDPCE